MNTPTPEQIAKLPKWAQAHLRRLERDRNEAVTAMQRWQDDQTPSQAYYEEMNTLEGVAHFPKRYVQSSTVCFDHEGVSLRVNLVEGRGIELSWGPETMHGLGDLCFIPTCYQQARITNMAFTPHEYERLLLGRKRKEQS